MKKQIVLASASPRRKEILELVGLSFQVLSSDKEEITVQQKPVAIVEELSNQKALDVAQNLLKTEENGLIYVIGADTIVVMQGEILGKPVNKEDAFRMLSMLQGNIHQVYTGVTVVKIENGGLIEKKTFCEETCVEMYPMTQKEIENYIATEEPMDKAGGYAIQGKCALYIKCIEGDYYNVMGLPIAKLRYKFPAIFEEEV